MTKNFRAFFVLAIAAVAVVFMAHSAFANASSTTKPGWGYGDTNHVHTGPPGQSVRP